MSNDEGTILIERIKANDPALIDVKIWRKCSELLDALSQNTIVTSLEVWLSFLSLLDAIELKRILGVNVKITSIRIHACQGKKEIAQVIAEALYSASSLTSLGVFYEEIGDCNSEEVKIFDQMIFKSKNLKTILIAGYPKSSNGLAKLIASHPLLEELDLRECSLTEDTAQSCEESLKKLNYLKTLAIDYYRPAMTGWEPEMTHTLSYLKRALADLLSRNTLSALKLCTDSLRYKDAVDARQLGSAVAKCRSLTELKISYLNYGMSMSASELEFFAGFANDFKQNHSIKKLWIRAMSSGGNREVWHRLAGAISQNTVLEFLDLSFVKSDFITFLPQALGTNRTLLSLNVKGLLEGHEDLVEKNFRLLQLGSNDMNNPKVDAVLERNKTMLTKSFSLLIKTLYNPEENASLIRLLPKDILIKILKLVHPGFTPMVFESFKNRFFFKPETTSTPVGHVSAIYPSESP